MLKRYKMWYRQPKRMPLPDGLRQDTRKHTRHCLRPPEDIVSAYLEAPSERAWETFRNNYLKKLEKRRRRDASVFDTLAALAQRLDVYLGCSCPTKDNPDPTHCHTFLALEFMKRMYPDLIVDPHVYNVEGS